MYLQNFLSAFYVGIVYHYLPVEASRTEQSGVQDILTVRSRHNDYTFVALEAVHFNKELVKGLFALVVTAAETRAAVASHSVYLVYENYRGRIFLCRLEQVADS